MGNLTQQINDAKDYVRNNQKCINTRASDNAINALKESLNNKNLILFVGSGISTFPPSCIPMGYVFAEVLIQTLMNTYNKTTDSFKKILNEIPFEVLLFFGEEASNKNKIQCLLKKLYGGISWNPVHKSLSVLLNKVPALITTNGDIFIEAAFLNGNIDEKAENNFDILLKKKGILRIFKDNEGLNNISDDSSILFKIHGSIDFPESIVYQINQEGKLPHSKSEILQKLISDKDILFIGYSGRDFDILPQLLKYNYKKVYWNIKDDNIDKNITGEACLLISQREGVPLIGHLGELLNKIDNSISIPTSISCPKSQQQVQSYLLDIFTKDELLYWYGIILTRLGLGHQALDILNLVAENTVCGWRLLKDKSEALFHDGKYQSSYSYYKDAASLVEANSALWVALQLGAADTLRQQCKLTKQLWFLIRCWGSLRVLKKSGKENHQEWASFYTYIAQHPIMFFLKQWQERLLKKAIDLRREKPMSSQLLLPAIQVYCLQKGIKVERGEELLVPTDFDDVVYLNKRIGHIVGEIDAYRKKAIELTQEASGLGSAEKTAYNSFELSKNYKHDPGKAKGMLLLAKISYLKKDYKKATEQYKEARDYFLNLELSRVYTWFLRAKLSKGLLLARLKMLFSSWQT